MAEAGWIPKISDGEIALMLEHITPLVQRDGLHTVESSHPRSTSYPWMEVDQPVASEDLEEIQRIRTYHSWGHYSMFKPSVAEVFAQIPVELRGTVGAFLVIGPDTAEDLNREQKAMNAGYHVAETILYKRKSQVPSPTVWERLNET